MNKTIVTIILIIINSFSFIYSDTSIYEINRISKKEDTKTEMLKSGKAALTTGIPKYVLTNEKLEEYIGEVEKGDFQNLKKIVIHYYNIKDENQLFMWCKIGFHSYDLYSLIILYSYNWDLSEPFLLDKKIFLERIKFLSEQGDSEALKALLWLDPNAEEE